jgi:uncharacterized protein YkwD/LysM repeat protein
MKTRLQSLLLTGSLLFTTVAAHAQCPQKPAAGQHIIKAGDTLYKLSKDYKVSLGDLCSWNKLTVYDTLKMCQMLAIQNPTALTSAASPVTYSSTTNAQTPEVAQAGALTAKGVRQNNGKHTVQPGETLAQLADSYGYTEWRFRQINAMRNDATLTVGSTILTSDCACPPIWSDNTEAQTGQAAPVSGTNPVSQDKETSTQSAAPSNITTGSQMSQLELDMINEINLMRSNPAGYVQYVNQFQSETMIKASKSTIDELIAELKRTAPLSNLSPASCLLDAAKWHAESQRPKGDIDHQGVDGSWPWDRAKTYCNTMTDGNENIVGGPATVRGAVVVLLLDEGITSRGHRKTLMRPDWKYVACYSAGTVGSMPNCYVQMFGK